MSGTPFHLAGADLLATASGALWYPAERLLCVSDLHLGKSERAARRNGSLIPPYDSRDTLFALSQDIASWDPQTVICLGDSFDDALSLGGLTADEVAQLAALKAGREWIWIAGNHDPGPLEIGGTWVSEISRGPLLFRHIAENPARPGEVSGHYHPKHRFQGRRGRITRKAYLYDRNRLILPAYGTYTGGLRSDDAALRSLFGQRAFAILIGPSTIACPLP